MRTATLLKSPAPSIRVAPGFVTQGQAALANGCTQEAGVHLYMATLQPEGESYREEHIEAAKDELRRAAKYLGMEVRERADG